MKKCAFLARKKERKKKKLMQSPERSSSSEKEEKENKRKYSDPQNARPPSLKEGRLGKYKKKVRD